MLLKTLKLRYAVLFSCFLILSSAVLFLISYGLLYSSLRREERTQIQARLLEIWALYQTGGVQALQREIIIEKSLEYGRPFLLRLADRWNRTFFLYIPEQWGDIEFKDLSYFDPFEERGMLQVPIGNRRGVLQIATVRLGDGNVLQIGFHSGAWENVLGQYRKTFALVALPLVAFAFLGGLLFSGRALAPLGRLEHSIRTILDTGAMHARVPTAGQGDELNRLVSLYNQLLDKVESLMKSMRGALDNVAHDLRTPMTRMRGTAEMALQAAEGIQVQREALTVCLEESERILAMLNTLMDISEAETGIMRLERTQRDLGVLLDDMIELYGYAASEKGISIVRKQPTPVSAVIDVNRFRQVIANLLDNAVKYTAGGGTVEVTLTSEGDRALVRVKDSGIGISLEELPHIWDRLYRGDRSRRVSGLGLGLSVVKAIVEAHGGTVSVTSTPGKGSEFTITIPLSA
ncbi:MAG: HAMP domain-containing histidine kinase [Spirochaetaceae bacterium]|nr:MAG: HAMP domain-containing histidine kinase [Spirochaetaceae bacterium]